MKKYLIPIFILLLLFGCTKTPELTKEQSTPAARSSFSREQLMKEIVTPWLDADNTRKVGVAAPTGSMLRVLDSTSICLLERVNITDKLNVGDILVYRNLNFDNRNITHRLMKINNDGTLVIKGDNNSEEDPLVDRRDVLYRVVGILYTDGK